MEPDESQLPLEEANLSDKSIDKETQIKAAEKLKDMFKTPPGFEVQTIIPEEKDEDQTIGIKVNSLTDPDKKPFVLVPQFDSDGGLVGFMQKLERGQKIPESIVNSVNDLAIQFARENEIIQGMKRAMAGNDYTNRKAVPKPPLGPIKKRPS